MIAGVNGSNFVCKKLKNAFFTNLNSKDLWGSGKMLTFAIGFR